jgi:signal transduction histidine kinase
VRGTIDPEGATVVEIIDGLPYFLDELVEILRKKDVADARDECHRANELAVHHGSQRFHAGFSLGAVIREYGVLRECLLDLIRDRHLPVDIGELQVMMDALNAAVANATEQFVRERDHAIEEQNQRHFGFIAHELRNPLGSALLAANALQRRPGFDADVVLMRLVRNLGAMRDLIDNTLTGVRTEDLARNGTLEIAEIPLGELVCGVREELSGDAEDKGISVTVDGQAVIRGDLRLIRSAIANLLRNAVKYTGRGGSIHVRLREGNDVASVEIEDQCGGLPEGKTEELFIPFVQRGGDRSGFGLGLAITKAAVETHRGRVQVSNVPGRGCIFMATFPTAGSM